MPKNTGIMFFFYDEQEIYISFKIKIETNIQI